MFICDTDAWALLNCARGFAGLTVSIKGNFRSVRPAEFDLTVLAALLHDAISMYQAVFSGVYYIVVWTNAPVASISIEGHMIRILQRALVVVLIR